VVALRAASRRAQRGVALLAMMAIVVMGVAYTLASRLNAASRFITVDREYNGKVLNQAKQALIGWVAINAAQTDNNPGRLPCPEAVNSISTDSEGISAPLVTPSTPNCANVGRLPWRTLGLDKLVDANTAPLWYVVSPGWALQNSSTLLSINSDSRGALVVDGQAAPNDVVALIIAPGPAMTVAATGSCTARAQVRSAPAPSMDPRDYIECFNSATPAFSTVGPSTSFNDQVVKVTTADLLPAIEAAIAHRAQREIVPVLKTIYTSSQYGGIPASSPLYPYAAPFANPGPGSGTSDYAGATAAYRAQLLTGPGQPLLGTYQGLLPFNQTQGCTVAASNPRCLPSLVQYAQTPAPAVEVFGYGTLQAQSCSWESTDNVRLCEGEYVEAADPTRPIRIEMTATFTNVAMGLRALDSSRMQVTASNGTAGPWVPATVTYTATMNSGSVSGRPRGSVTVTFGATLPNIDAMGWGHKANFRMRLERAVIGDHPLLDTANATLGWFVRNEWYRVLYYAAAQTNTADGLPSLGCSSGSNCLRMSFPAASDNIRSLLILGGRSMGGMARPNNVITDYLEFQNNDGDVIYEQRPISRVVNAALMSPFNDRVLVVDQN